MNGKNFTRRIISFILVAIMAMGILPLSAANVTAATDTSWKQYLKDFLVENCSSIFDDSWQQDYYKNGTIPNDFIVFNESVNNSYLMPYRYTFYDLDNDNIPEALIYYGIMNSEGVLCNIYKLYGTTFEKIGETSIWTEYYVNPQNKSTFVSLSPYDEMVYSICFMDIQNKKLILNNYIDSKGNTKYNGFEYKNLGDTYEFGGYIYNIGVRYEELADELALLKPFLEFDCSDIINSIKSGTPLMNASTVLDKNFEGAWYNDDGSAITIKNLQPDSFDFAAVLLYYPNDMARQYKNPNIGALSGKATAINNNSAQMLYRDVDGYSSKNREVIVKFELSGDKLIVTTDIPLGSGGEYEYFGFGYNVKISGEYYKKNNLPMEKNEANTNLFITVTGDKTFSSTQSEQILNLSVKISNIGSHIIGYNSPTENEEKQKMLAKNVQIFIDRPQGANFSNLNNATDSIVIYPDNYYAARIDVGDLSYAESKQYDIKYKLNPAGISSFDFKVWVYIDGELAETTTYTINRDNAGGFDLRRDGWRVVNGNEGFSYDKKYRIPLERYEEVFKDEKKGEIKKWYKENVETETWKGSCFGMAATAIMFYNQMLNIGDYTNKDIDNINFAYDNFVVKPILGIIYGDYYNLNENSEFTKLIERYHIWQYDKYYTEIRFEYLDTFNRNYSDMFRHIITNVLPTKEPLIVHVKWDKGESGHSLVIDTNRTPIRNPDNLGDDWYRVWLYDPNNPSAFSSANLKSYYSQTMNRYVDLNIHTGQWKMIVQTNSAANGVNLSGVEGDALTWLNKINDRSETLIWFEKVDKYPLSFNDQNTLTASLFDKSGDTAKTRIDIASSNITITNNMGEIIYQTINGSIGVRPPLGQWIIPIGVTVDEEDDSPSLETIWLPIGTYSIQATGDSTVSIGVNNHSVYVTSEKKCEYSIDISENKINFLSKENNANARISLVNGVNEWSCIELEGKLSNNEKVEFALDDNNNFKSMANKDNLKFNIIIADEDFDEKSVGSHDISNFKIPDILDFIEDISNNSTTNEVSASKLTDASKYTEKGALTGLDLASAIDILNQLGVVAGVSNVTDKNGKIINYTFGGDSLVTRQQFALFTARIATALPNRFVVGANSSIKTNTAFVDLVDKTYTPAIDYCYAEGIILGRNEKNTIFDPTGSIKFAEALTMLTRALGYTGLTYPTGFMTKAADPDVGLIGNHADFPMGNIGQDKAINRAQMAMLLWNFLLSERRELEMVYNRAKGEWDSVLVVRPILQSFGYTSIEDLLQSFGKTIAFSATKNENQKITVGVTDENNRYSPNESEPNNTTATANLLALNTDITGNISNINDVDYFKIHMSESADIQIKFTVSQKVDSNVWAIKLYDSDNKELKSYKVGAGGIYLQDSTKYYKTEKISLVPGDYFVSILPYTKTEFSNEAYTLKVLDPAGQIADLSKGSGK